MAINLHNYEEYFLLYADNELAADDRQAVLDFISLHPHLEEEWKMICDAVLTPEPLAFDLKNSLLREESTGIHTGNYEEYFIRYHDNELNEEERIQTNEFVETHPELKEEFELLGMARMPQEDVHFPDMQSLLRKEPAGKLKILVYRAMAAAAVILIAVLLLPSAPFVATDEPAQIAGSPSSVQPHEAASPNEQAFTPDNEQTVARKPVSEEESKESVRTSLAPVQAVHESHTVSPPEHRQKIESNTVIAKQIAEPSFTETIEIPTSLDKTVPDVFAAAAHTDVNETPVRNQISAKQVVHLNVEKEPDFYYNSIPGEDLQRTKLGIFLKKVKRIAERNDPIKRLFEGDEIASK